MNSTVSYIAARMNWPYQGEWYGGPTGVSSDAMLRQALGGDPVDFEWEYPHDVADYARCRLAYKKAPRRLRRKMRPIMREYRRILRQRQNERRQA